MEQHKLSMLLKLEIHDWFGNRDSFHTIQYEISGPNIETMALQLKRGPFEQDDSRT